MQRMRRTWPTSGAHKAIGNRFCSAWPRYKKCKAKGKRCVQDRQQSCCSKVKGKAQPEGTSSKRHAQRATSLTINGHDLAPICWNCQSDMQQCAHYRQLGFACRHAYTATYNNIIIKQHGYTNDDYRCDGKA